MHSIRDALGVPSAVLPGPGLVVTGRSLNEVRAAAEATCRVIAPPPCPDLEVRTWRRGSAAEAVAWAAAAGDDGEWRSDDTAPVHELPSGEVVGRWGVSASSVAGDGTGGWTAFPGSLRPDGHRWLLRSPPGDVETVDDAVELEVFDTATVAVRVPGWVTADVRPGSPAGILIEKMARQAARSGVVLWVPGVTEEALHLVLRTGSRVWVDGPATPATTD
jgi:hypothetical protein